MVWVVGGVVGRLPVREGHVAGNYFITVHFFFFEIFVFNSSTQGSTSYQVCTVPVQVASTIDTSTLGRVVQR